MRPTLILLSVLIFSSLVFSLNISQSIDGDKIAFRIDGPHFVKVDLSMFLFLDGVQTQAFQKENVTLPYYYYLPYEKGGFYELRVVNMKNASDYGAVKGDVPSPASVLDAINKPAQDEMGVNLAIAAGVLGLVVIGYFLVSFIKIRSDKK